VGPFVNSKCVVCGQRIQSIVEGRVCEECGRPVHSRCFQPRAADAEENQCTVCGSDRSQAVAQRQQSGKLTSVSSTDLRTAFLAFAFGSAIILGFTSRSLGLTIGSLALLFCLIWLYWRALQDGAIQDVILFLTGISIVFYICNRWQRAKSPVLGMIAAALLVAIALIRDHILPDQNSP
jgi:hypothetical protein